MGVSTVLLVGAGVLTYPFAALMAMATASCFSPEERPICDPLVQQFVVLLPIVAVILALGVGLFGGLRAVGRRRSPGPWLAASWAITFGALIVSYTLASAGPSQEYLDKERTANAREREKLIERDRKSLLKLPSQQEGFPHYERFVREMRQAMIDAYPRLDWWEDQLLRDAGDASRDCLPFLDPSLRSQRLQAEWDVGIDDKSGDYVTIGPAEQTKLIAVARKVGKRHGFHLQKDKSDDERVSLRDRHGGSVELSFVKSVHFTVQFESPCMATASDKKHLKATPIPTPR